MPKAEEALEPKGAGEPPPARIHVIVVIDEVDGPTLKALRVAQATHPASLLAMTACTEIRDGHRVIKAWADREIDVPLRAAYATRDDDDPVLAYVDRVRRNDPAAAVQVFLPVVVTDKRWQRSLHRERDPGLSRRLACLDRVVVTRVPWRLGKERADPDIAAADLIGEDRARGT